jgi:hypothetical protein
MDHELSGNPPVRLTAVEDYEPFIGAWVNRQGKHAEALPDDATQGRLIGPAKFLRGHFPAQGHAGLLKIGYRPP